MIFVFEVVRDQSGRSSVVTASDSVHRTVIAYNKADLSGFDYGSVKAYNDDGHWVASAMYLPTGNLTSDAVLEQLFKR